MWCWHKLEKFSASVQKANKLKGNRMGEKHGKTSSVDKDFLIIIFLPKKRGFISD